jgi:hypothetical protein
MTAPTRHPPQMGIKQPDKLAIASTRNDLAFLVTTVGVFSVLALLLGQLPGDWVSCRGGGLVVADVLMPQPDGSYSPFHTHIPHIYSISTPSLFKLSHLGRQGFFGQYLSGSMILVVMGIGSTAPGLLQGVIDQFSQVFPDYKQRVVEHEAAHFLVGCIRGGGRVVFGGGVHGHLEGRRLVLASVEKAAVGAVGSGAIGGSTAAAAAAFHQRAPRSGPPGVPPQPPAPHPQVGYLLGVPVMNYSVAMTKEHVEFADCKLQVGAGAGRGGPGEGRRGALCRLFEAEVAAALCILLASSTNIHLILSHLISSHPSSRLIHPPKTGPRLHQGPDRGGDQRAGGGGGGGDRGGGAELRGGGSF